MNTRQALKRARKLGVTVTNRKGTGEWKLTHPDWGRCLLVNGGRKDAPRILICLLKRIS